MDTTNFLKDPDNFIKNLYKIEKPIFGKSTVSSPYLKIDDPKLKCLLDDTCGIKQEIKQGWYKINGKLLQVMRINPSSEILPESYTNVNLLEEYRYKMIDCLYGTFQSQEGHVASDLYTNNLLISSVLKYIYNRIPIQAGLHGIQILEESSIINSDTGTLGVNLYSNDSVGLISFMSNERNFDALENVDINNFGTVTNRIRVFSKNFIIDLFRQLLTNLQMLQSKYSFNHGNLTQDKILVKRSPSNIAFNTIRNSSEFTFMISDFRYASMNINSGFGRESKLYRLFNANKYAEKYFLVFPFKPVIDKSFDQAYYSIDDVLDIQLLAKIRHLGIPFYSSFDTMTLVISLLLIPQIYYRVFTDPELKRIIWDSLWHPQETKIFGEIQKLVESDKGTTYPDILNLLKGKWIKCNITDILISELS